MVSFTLYLKYVVAPKIKHHEGTGKAPQKPNKHLQPALLYSLKHLPEGSPFMEFWGTELQQHLNKEDIPNKTFRDDLERLADLTEGENDSMNVFSKTNGNGQPELGRFTLIHPISYLEVSR